MKLYLSLFLIALISSSQAYYEDHVEVIRLSEAGLSTVIKNSTQCPRRFHPKKERDLIKGRDFNLCVAEREVPEEVTFEVMQMKEAELENESDYDQRVTALFSFSWSALSGQSFSFEALKSFSRAMNIPENHLKDIQVKAEVVNESTFSMFNNLFVGLEFFDRSQVLTYLMKEYKGELVQIISFGDGVSLYPGGGFYVTHYLIIAKDKATYVKLSWWNS